MEMIIDFPGGSRVDAHFGPFTVATDQPPVASAPTPFAVFLSSIGTCAGIYVLGFCQQRGIPTEGCGSSSASIAIPLPIWSTKSIWRSRFRPVSRISIATH